MIWVAVAVGGVAGATARYAVYLAIARLLGTGFPLATLVVNVVGSFGMGVLIELGAQRWSLPQEWRALLIVGLLGSFTTFSTFSLDAVVLAERQRWMAASIYVLGSVIGSIAGLIGGLSSVRWILKA